MSTTTTVNYGFIKPAPGTEKDVWGPYLNTNADNIDTQIKNRQNEAAAKLPLAGGTLTGKLILIAGVAGNAPLNVPQGVAPTTPVNGDFWSTSAAFFGRINGATVQLATSADLTAGLATKANTSHSHAQSDVTNLTADLALKAPLASPALTGTPTAPTATAGTSTTQLATTAFVGAAVAAGSGLSAATAAEIFAGTVNTKAVTPNNAALANNEVAVADGATITIPFDQGINFAVGALAGNRTLAASGLAAALVGRSGFIKFTQDATGSRTLNSSGATWKNINAEDIILSTTANAVDYVFYTILSTTTVLLSIARNVG